MFKSIDVLIGLTVIMLALSMAVTVMTQFVTAAINSRGHYLKRGLVDLLGQIDPGLDDRVAGEIAKAVLRNPLVSATWGRLGSVIQREEFTKLLMHLASDEARYKFPEKERAVLKAALARNGIEDPAATLKSVRAAALALELVSPELAANVRQNRALLQEAKSDLVAKVNGWFDQTVDRVSQRYTALTRGIVFVAAVLVAAALQVDAVLLVNRLAADDKLRAAFLAQARNTPPAADAGAPATSETEKIDREYLTFLNDNGLITVPRSLEEWQRHWKDVSPLGVATTALLLSLGAPFWHSALSRLLQLRSTLAQKDELQRAVRQGVEPRTESAS
jgi:hypothetical protein